MSRMFLLTSVASLALAFAASSASAQTAGIHASPSERATQGAIIDPNFHPTVGGIVDPNVRKTAGEGIDPNFRKTDGSINYANGQTPRDYSVGGGGGGRGSERMGIVIEEHKLVGTSSETYTPNTAAHGPGGGGVKQAAKKGLWGSGEEKPY